MHLKYYAHLNQSLDIQEMTVFPTKGESAYQILEGTSNYCWKEIVIELDSALLTEYEVPIYLLTHEQCSHILTPN